MDSILGLSVPAFTTLHVIISLIGIVAGLMFLIGLATGRFSPGLNAVFLAFTLLTSITGFFFHSKVIGPPHAVGAVSLVVLAVALVALYGFGRANRWRIVYAVAAAIAEWLNVLVLVTQAFQKIALLRALAPTGSEPVVAVAQGIGFLLFVWLGWRAVKSRA